MKRLAIVTTHPIQYNAPLFRLLAASSTVQLKVFYTWEQSSAGAKYDPGFGREIEWDIPMLEGYEYSFVKNIARDPGTHHFNGLVNPDLKEEIEEWKPDAILIFGWSFKSHLECMRYFHRKVPIIFRGDSTLLDERPGVRKLFRRLFLRWVYRYVDYVLYVGKNNKAYFLKHGLKDNQLFFAPHAIDNQRFSEPAELYDRQAADWRNELNIKVDDLAILFVGKLEPKKNPEFLLEVLKNIASERLKIIIVGNGILEEQLKIATAGDPRVIFLDFQNQSKMPVIYRLGDVFILPSKGPGETWGLAANEAMASGRALILSEKVGCANDLIREDGNGIFFNVTEPGKCFEFIDRLLTNKRILKSMQDYSKEYIREYSFEHIVKAIEKVCDRV